METYAAIAATLVQDAGITASSARGGVNGSGPESAAAVLGREEDSDVGAHTGLDMMESALADAIRRAGAPSAHCKSRRSRSVRPASGAFSVKRVYLAGPPYAEEYRRRATVLVRSRGWEPVDPMRRDFRGRTEGREREIVEGDLADIDSCDAVLAAFTHADEGTAMEAWYAHGTGKPVIVYTGGAPPHPWTVYVAARVCVELDEAVSALDNT